MSTPIKIEIPKPCHENWDKMSPTEKGRFCKVCTKEVIDFTQKSDEEIHQIISTKTNICGRMSAKQLGREIKLSRKLSSAQSYYIAALLLPLALGTSQDAISQGKINPHYISQKEYKSLKIGSNYTLNKINKQSKFVVSGIVADFNDQPISGATVFIKGSKDGVITDAKGKYAIEVTNEQILVFSSIGYKSIEITVKSPRTIRVNLEEPELQGEIIVGRIAAMPKKKN